MKYYISILIAALFFALIVFAFVYWIIGWESQESLLLGALSFVIGILGEVARFFLLKRAKSKEKKPR